MNFRKPYRMENHCILSIVWINMCKYVVVLILEYQLAEMLQTHLKFMMSITLDIEVTSVFQWEILEVNELWNKARKQLI